MIISSDCFSQNPGSKNHCENWIFGPLARMLPGHSELIKTSKVRSKHNDAMHQLWTMHSLYPQTYQPPASNLSFNVEIRKVAIRAFSSAGCCSENHLTKGKIRLNTSKYLEIPRISSTEFDPKIQGRFRHMHSAGLCLNDGNQELCASQWPGKLCPMLCFSHLFSCAFMPSASTSDFDGKCEICNMLVMSRSDMNPDFKCHILSNSHISIRFFCLRVS